MGDEYTREDLDQDTEFARGRWEAQIGETESFDRWLAEVERAAAEKAWDRCIDEMPIDPDWKNFYSDNNPYRAEEYRQEKGGQ